MHRKCESRVGRTAGVQSRHECHFACSDVRSADDLACSDREPVQSQDSIPRNSINTNVRQTLSDIRVGEGKVTRSQCQGRVLWRGESLVSAVRQSIWTDKHRQRGVRSSPVSVAYCVVDYHCARNVQCWRKVQLVAHDSDRAQGRVDHRRKSDRKGIAVQIDIIADDIDRIQRRIYRCVCQVIDGYRWVVDGHHTDRCYRYVCEVGPINQSYLNGSVNCAGSVRRITESDRLQCEQVVGRSGGTRQ